MKDLRGVEIKKGDRVVYGKSDRSYPIAIGTVDTVYNNGVDILGDGRTKCGFILSPERIIVLPKDY